MENIVSEMSTILRTTLPGDGPIALIAIKIHICIILYITRPSEDTRKCTAVMQIVLKPGKCQAYAGLHQLRVYTRDRVSVWHTSASRAIVRWC